MTNGFQVYYMISEPADRKYIPKIEGASKERCLSNFKNEFKNSKIVYCIDNISHGVESFIKFSLRPNDEIISIAGGTQARAFRSVLNESLKLLSTHPANTPILIQEDDYIYLPGAEQKLLEALDYSHYVTGYLHPDKFMEPSRGGNPSTYAENISEETRVVKTKSSYWMMTNSTTCTFATTLSTLKEDLDVWMNFTQKNVTEDYHAFLELRKRGRSLLMPIPTLSTHAMPQWLAPLTGTNITNWGSLL